MVSYIKTQWWRLLCGFACIIYACVIAFTSTAVADSVEGVYMLLGDVVKCGLWFLASCFWFIMSIVAHHEDCIRELNNKIRILELKVETLEYRAITDIEEVSRNHFEVRRRLGPDSDT